MDDLIDLDEMGRSLNGFEEIAIERYFMKAVHELTGTALVRALHFIAEKRAGMGDPDAFKKVMDSAIGDLMDRVKRHGDDEGKD